MENNDILKTSKYKKPAYNENRMLQMPFYNRLIWLTEYLDLIVLSSSNQKYEFNQFYRKGMKLYYRMFCLYGRQKLSFEHIRLVSYVASKMKVAYAETPLPVPT